MLRIISTITLESDVFLLRGRERDKQETEGKREGEKEGIEKKWGEGEIERGGRE